jgi:hypothetical protein
MFRRQNLRLCSFRGLLRLNLLLHLLRPLRVRSQLQVGFDRFQRLLFPIGGSRLRLLRRRRLGRLRARLRVR